MALCLAWQAGCASAFSGGKVGSESAGIAGESSRWSLWSESVLISRFVSPSQLYPPCSSSVASSLSLTVLLLGSIKVSPFRTRSNKNDVVDRVLTTPLLSLAGEVFSMPLRAMGSSLSTCTYSLRLLSSIEKTTVLRRFAF